VQSRPDRRCEVVVTTDGEVRYETVFRERWRDSQSAGARPGELIKQPGWIDPGLVGLAVLVAAGAVAASAVTVAQTVALPAVVQGTSVTADRTGASAPAPGTPVQLREGSGTTLGAVVVEVTPTEVTAQLDRPSAASTGELLVPVARQRLVSVLLPRFW
jgi:hypothetical protein